MHTYHMSSVLDLMLPGFDGLEVCRRLRQFSDAYVLMLSARTDEVDRVVGLEPDPAHPVYVETVRGVGYRFGAREAAAAT